MENEYAICSKCGGLVYQGVCIICGAAYSVADASDKRGEEEDGQKLQEANCGTEGEPLDNNWNFENKDVYGGNDNYVEQEPEVYTEPDRKKNYIDFILVGVLLVLVILLTYWFLTWIKKHIEIILAILFLLALIYSVISDRLDRYRR